MPKWKVQALIYETAQWSAKLEVEADTAEEAKVRALANDYDDILYEEVVGCDHAEVEEVLSVEMLEE